jgi:hypothetical protein
MKGKKHGELKEALATWIRQLNITNFTATDKGIKELAKMICKYCTLLMYEIFF